MEMEMVVMEAERGTRIVAGTGVSWPGKLK